MAIVWLVDPLFPEIDRLHAIFELRERHTHVLFSDQLEFHVLQLSALSSSRPTVGYADPRVERWARFLMASDDAELDQLASEDPIMALAKDALDKLSQDPEAHRLALEREESLAIYNMHIAASRMEGVAHVLLKQLGMRFGPLSEATRTRIQRGTSIELERWSESVLTAATLDEVFTPPQRPR